MMMDFPKLNITAVLYKDGRDPSNCLKVKQIPPQNVVMRLAGRQMWGGFGPRVGTEKYLQRSMQQSIVPNFTVTHVEKPGCFLRKFTPDGKLFVTFTSDQMSVEVYYFQGPQAANHLFQDLTNTWTNRNGSENVGFRPPPEKRPRMSKSDIRAKVDPYSRGFPDIISAEDRDNYSQEIRRKIFDAFFKLKFRVSVSPQGEDLNRECSLFTEDFRYLIVGSATYVQEEYIQPTYYEIYRTNESVEPNQKLPLEDYSIHIVDLKNGVLTDSKHFRADRIFLSHNQGLYLFNNTLAVLSVQHQTISIFHVDNGQFWPVRTIGRFCYEDDELLYSAVPSFSNVRPKDEAFFCSLKQRLMAFLFRKAYERADESGGQDVSDISRLRQYYEQLVNLKIWKMQLLDEDYLLLKYSSEEVVTLRAAEPNSQHCLFVIYNIPSTEVIAVFENTTEELVDFFENFADSFRNNNMTVEGRFASSPSNNMYARQIHQKFRQTITSARYGGPVEATKRILAQLPISAQSYSSSPYLDQALFSYDDHRVSTMERPKACGEIPIRFYGRDSGIYKFQIHAGILARGSSPSGRRLVAFTFHPSAPFAISVQRANAEYLVHFHLRLEPSSLIRLEPNGLLPLI